MLIQDYQENYQISEKNSINKICNFLNNLAVRFNKAKEMNMIELVHK